MKHPFAPLRELADTTRLRVFLAILGPRKNVSQIVSELGLAQPQVSYHLRRLKRAGLAVEEKDGRWVWYQADWDSGDPHIRDFLDLMSRWSEDAGVAATPRVRRAVEVAKSGSTGAGIMSGQGGGRSGQGAGRGRRADRPRVVPAKTNRREDGEGRPVIDRPDSPESDMDDFLL